MQPRRLPSSAPGSPRWALALLAYQLAGGDAGAVLGTALAIKVGTYVVITPVAAAFVERLPRRTLMVCLDLVRAAVVLTLPFVTQVWEIYALIFLFQAASAAFTPPTKPPSPTCCQMRRSTRSRLHVRGSRTSSKAW
jgi:hypothetical protein